MRLCVWLRNAKLTLTGNITLTIRTFLPAIMTTSSRMHGEFLRLLFLQAHRETTAHFLATGLPSQQNRSDNEFRFKRAAFYMGLKGKVGERERERERERRTATKARSRHTSASGPRKVETCAKQRPRPVFSSAQGQCSRPHCFFLPWAERVGGGRPWASSSSSSSSASSSSSSSSGAANEGTWQGQARCSTEHLAHVFTECA